MKTRKLSKKLSLNKNTVSNLSTADMVKLVGGREDDAIAVQDTNTTCDVNLCGWYTEGPPPYGCLWTQIVVDSICVVCYKPKTETVAQVDM